MEKISIEPIPVVGRIVDANEKPLKIVEGNSKGKKISFAIKVSIPTMQNIIGNADEIDKFLSMELDPSTQILTLHFSKSNKKEESELAHEMR